MKRVLIGLGIGVGLILLYKYTKNRKQSYSGNIITIENNIVDSRNNNNDSQPIVQINNQLKEEFNFVIEEKEEQNEKEKEEKEIENENENRIWVNLCNQFLSLSVQPGRNFGGGIEDSVENIKKFLCGKYANDDLFEQDDFKKIEKNEFLSTQIDKLKKIVTSSVTIKETEIIKRLKMFASDDGIEKFVSVSDEIFFSSIENPFFSLYCCCLLGSDKKWKYFYSCSWASNF